MVLSGGSLPPRASRSTKLNSDPDRSSSPRIRPPPPKRKTTESHHDSAGQRLFQRPARYPSSDSLHCIALASPGLLLSSASGVGGPSNCARATVPPVVVNGPAAGFLNFEG